MIEMVYSGKEHEKQDEVRIPKNIHQIGSNQSNRKIYIEDYVMKTLKIKPANEESVKYGVLLGEVKRTKGNVYIFVKGMVEVRDIIENSIIFNDEIWSGIYRDIKQYFERLNIVGWYVSIPYRVSDDMKGIKKNHLDNFAGNDKVCFLTDREENEEGFFVYGENGFEKQQGYYIYYEKNEKMKKYVKNMKNSTSDNLSSKNNRDVSDEKITNPDEATKNRGLVDIKLKSSKNEEEEKCKKSFREILNEEGMEPRSQGRIAYGVSGLLIVALLLSTVVMLSNYGELKNIKSTLAGISRDNEAKAVNEILSAYTESVTEESVTDKNDVTSVQTNTSNNIKDDSIDENENKTSENKNEKKSENNSEIKKEDVDNSITNTSDESNDKIQNNNDVDKKESVNKSISSVYSGQYHTVTSGQTLYDISMKYYGTSKMVDEIKERNNIDDDYTIRDGQRILLP